MFKLFNILIIAIFTTVAGCSDDHSTKHHHHDDDMEHAIEHAFTHMQDGPFDTITIAATDDIQVMGKGHTAYTIELEEAEEGVFEGTVEVTVGKNGDFLFLLDENIKVVATKENEETKPAKEEGSVEIESNTLYKYVFHIHGDRPIYLTFGPTDISSFTIARELAGECSNH